MEVALFSYHLPEHLIAQYPPKKRGSSRLMVVNRTTREIAPTQFSRLPQLLPSPALMVLNDARVIPARLLGRKETGGRVECFLVHKVEPDCWECLVKPGRAWREGKRLILGEGQGTSITAIVEEVLPSGRRRVRFSPPPGLSLKEALNRVGQVPLPPYIQRPPSQEDRERYQTVFARRGSAVAAPTAGLHFTNDMLNSLQERGIEIARITLNVGPGTFKPVKTEQVEEHQMEEEFFTIPDETAQKVNLAKEQGIPVIAVGTTVTRALESAACENGRVAASSRWTDLFIYPGYRFRVIDHLVTNFHLPRSTLLMLVCALGGRDLVLDAYRQAIQEEFRVYSYGDAMLVL